MTAAPTVGLALESGRNGFTGLRLGLAAAVVVSHAFSVATGTSGDEPLAHATGFTLGEHAVNGFFAVSGFLVTMSCDRRGWRDYVIARTLRILPGLVAATLVVSLVLGAAMTSLPLPAYLRDPGLWSFVRGTLTTFKSNAALPGVFETNPYRAPLGTVWTLKYEVLCYLGLLVASACGLLRRRLPVLLLVLALAVALASVGAERPKGVETALRLPLIFAAGACLYLWRERLRVSTAALACLAIGACVLVRTPAYPPLLFLAEAYGAVWLALGPMARGVFDPRADLSYGLYLYGWPVQQSLHALWPGASGVALLAPALAVTLPLAALSWYGVERPALALKARALGRSAARSSRPGRERPVTALPPAAALAHAVRLLEAEGFTILARNGRGDSLYLARAGERATLRVSNHARRPRQRRNHPEVATSLVIRGSRSTAQVEAMVAAALQNFSLMNGRADGRT